MTAQTLEQQCKARHGFWLAPGPGGDTYVYFPAGIDPRDGSPLTQARRATDAEYFHWRQGRLADLTELVALAAPPGWRPPARRIGIADIWRGIRRRVFGGRG